MKGTAFIRKGIYGLSISVSVLVGIFDYVPPSTPHKALSIPYLGARAIMVFPKPSKEAVAMQNNVKFISAIYSSPGLFLMKVFCEFKV